MLGGLLFSLVRVAELVTIIPIVGMLAYFVDMYVKGNQVVPNYILVLFIVSVIASVYALFTLARRDSVRRNAAFVAFIDLCFVGAFIAGAYFLRGIASADCINVSGGIRSDGGLSTSPNSVTLSPWTISYEPFGVNANRTCTMLKASFAFAIMNCVLFFVSALLALMLHRRERGTVVEKTTYRRSSHGSRRGHSSHGSHHRRSSRDSRRAYYV